MRFLGDTTNQKTKGTEMSHIASLVTVAIVTIKGISPLLMRKMPLIEEPADLRNQPPKDQAEWNCYRDETTGRLYIPAANLQRALIGGATYSKGKGRSNLSKSAAACLRVWPDIIDLGVTNFEIDSRSVVIRATGGRVIRHRAKLNEWKATFKIDYSRDLLSEVQVRSIVDDTGARVGLLDFRPEKKGPFGRFVVDHWELE